MFDALYDFYTLEFVFVSAICMYFFLISTLYNFWLIPPTYCGSDISGTNQYLAPLWDVCCSRTAVGQLPAAAGPAAAPPLSEARVIIQAWRRCFGPLAQDPTHFTFQFTSKFTFF